MKNVIAVVAALIGLGLAGYWVVSVFGKIDGVSLSGHGVAAMVIGVIFTLLVGFGLMALLFFSNKHGHDEKVHNLNRDDDADQA
ncbi:hypothetical protein [Kordiimonas aestuarii]|uniref:hypothetical protein n=1 Tax=Kordiimonas aestuarii TaxID=1005925 RepID=UPI0021D38B1B|nr:hypothetical protein [Kordiimonas aestuarii]